MTTRRVVLSLLFGLLLLVLAACGPADTPAAEAPAAAPATSDESESASSRNHRLISSLIGSKSPLSAR